MAKCVIGIDEVGRGALAGPVVVAAALVPKNLGFRIQDLGELKDSKKLSPKKREEWFNYFRAHPQIKFAVARVYPRRIELLNISGAANRAAFTAWQRLSRSLPLATRSSIYLDGGLFLKSKAAQPENAKTIVKGDEKIPAVAVASIIAKVTRDRFMAKLHKKHPVFGFAAHKGYATKSHREAIEKQGPCEAHRLTFLGKTAIVSTWVTQNATRGAKRETGARTMQ